VVSRAISIVAMLALASSAHADSPKLEQARKAIDEVRFDDAQRLLVGALADGGNSPAAVREIYKLSASTAVVVGQREVGEQNYRRWLALDASASIGADVAPKLREPFEAAQAYIAAHGRLTAVATRVSATVIDVAVTDPLAMAVSATIVGGSPVALSTERRAQLVPSDGGAVVVAVLDDRGNRLVELSAGAAPVAAVVPAVTAPVRPPIQRDQPKEKRFRVWLVFAVPSAVLLLTGAGFALAASNDRDTIDEGIRDSTTTVYSDIDDLRSREIAFTALGATAFGLGVVLAVPAVILYLRAHDDLAVVPFVSGDSAGASLAGQF
jgi:hypothetical protein